MASDGFESTDTIKGMLFKLHNARFSLPKNSLLVVDEAGMIGNYDYQELLRVAATRKCTVILSGDERQLASVQRGGMFEIFADKYGSSTMLDISRQSSEWGKSVAMAFSKGEVETGVAILEQENRLKWQHDTNKSMQSLLSDWHKSSYAIADRLILAVRNTDVAALNHGVRQYLKADGKLTGHEIEVGGNYYMQGDRILISKTSKALDLINGDLAVVLQASKDRFTVSVKNADKYNTVESSNGVDVIKIVKFNPSEYSGFKHGYATTVFKAQGAYIKDVYVCHNGFAGLRNSYVALSRNINELNLYVNRTITFGKKSLIQQLSHDPDSGSSLIYLTENEEKLNKENIEILQNIGVVDKMLLGAYNFAARNLTKLTDKYLPASEYYNYQEPAKKPESVEEVLDKVYEQNQNMDFAVAEEKLIVWVVITSFLVEGITLQVRN